MIRVCVRLDIAIPSGIMYICGSETLPPPLSPEEEALLISSFEKGGEKVKSVLIEHNLRLVVYIARRFENTGIGIEDLISIGTIGLIKAINTYNPQKNIKLATYASRCIENEILMYLRKSSGQKTEVSFDEPLNTDWDGNELLLSDILGTEIDMVMRPIEDDVDMSFCTTPWSAYIKETDNAMRFGSMIQRKTQKEVADILGISSPIFRASKTHNQPIEKEITKLL